MMPHGFWELAIGVLGVLVVASIAGVLMAPKNHTISPGVKNFKDRVTAWWWLVGLIIPCAALGRGTITALFAAASFLALREFISLTPTARGDRLALFLAFFVAIPLQFILVGLAWYGLFSIMIPVYGVFILAAVSALTQDSSQFLRRSAAIQWAVMICVYGASHVPAITTLVIPRYSDPKTLLLYFVLIAQSSDVLQYVCGKLFGKHKLAPVLSPSKTWEGLIGGGILSCLLGTALYRFTPFAPYQAALICLVVVTAGFFGGLILSAVKRSLGAKDWGMSIPGHGGILDRLDSLVFSAPIFFHLVRYFFTV